MRLAVARLLAAAAAGLLGLPALAQVGNTSQPMTLSQISSRSVEAKYGRADSSFRLPNPSITAAASRTALIATTQPGPGPVVDVDVRVIRTVTRPAVARAIARSLPVVGNAIAVAELLELMRCEESFGGGVGCDTGQDEVPVGIYTVSRLHQAGPATYSASSATAAGAAAAAAANAYYNALPRPASRQEYRVSNCVPASCVGTFVTIQFQRRQCADPNSNTTCTYGSWADMGDQKGATQAPGLACPSIVTMSGSVVPVKGADGKCPTGIYPPITDSDFATRADQPWASTPTERLAGDLVPLGVPIDHEFPSIQPIPTPSTTRETTNNPDGSTTVRDTSFPWVNIPDGYGWEPTVSTRTYPPGETPPPPSSSPLPGGSTTTGSPPAEREITCGLPGTPPCKIDETGTPTQAPPMPVPADIVEPLRDAAQNPTVPDTGWTWSFSLPSNCSVLSAGTFAGQAVSVDLCQYQDMIHSIVGIGWLIATVWACIAMVGRTLTTA